MYYYDTGPTLFLSDLLCAETSYINNGASNAKLGLSTATPISYNPKLAASNFLTAPFRTRYGET